MLTNYDPQYRVLAGGASCVAHDKSMCPRTDCLARRFLISSLNVQVSNLNLQIIFSKFSFLDGALCNIQCSIRCCIQCIHTGPDLEFPT